MFSILLSRSVSLLKYVNNLHWVDRFVFLHGIEFVFPDVHDVEIWLCFLNFLQSVHGFVVVCFMDGAFVVFWGVGWESMPVVSKVLPYLWFKFFIVFVSCPPVGSVLCRRNSKLFSVLIFKVIVMDMNDIFTTNSFHKIEGFAS